VLRVLAATAVRDAQAGLVAFAAAPAPTLIAVAENEDLAAIAALLAIGQSELRSLLADGSRMMTNGLVCRTPTEPPAPHTQADDGFCLQLGSVVCRTCPAALAVPASTEPLWDQLRNMQRRAHIHVENKSLVHAEERTRAILLQVLAVLDPAGVAKWESSGQLPEPPQTQTLLPPRRRRRA
jgi:hypothetical protein